MKCLNKKQINAASLSPAPLKTTNSLIEELDISKYLVLKKEGEDGPDVKGGYLDALIVHASKVQKVNESGELLLYYPNEIVSQFKILFLHRASDSVKENGKCTLACSLYGLSSFFFWFRFCFPFCFRLVM